MMIETEIDLDLDLDLDNINLDIDLDQNLDLDPHINSKKTKNSKIKHIFLNIYHSNKNE